ncbi:MAG: VOC family protein [Gaiellaceae bacterium]
MKLDHIVVAVHDLDSAAECLEREHGLTSYVGGRHAPWGTANRIVPLGDSYVELIAVVDEPIAATSDVGRWVADGASSRGSPIGWAVRPDDLDATSRRLGLTAQKGSRTTPDGAEVRWRMAGIERALSDRLPWFIEWSDAATYPGVAESALDARVVRIELEGDAAQLEAWLGEHALPLEIRPGGRGITAVVLDGPHGTVTLGQAAGL